MRESRFFGVSGFPPPFSRGQALRGNDPLGHVATPISQGCVTSLTKKHAISRSPVVYLCKKRGVSDYTLVCTKSMCQGSPPYTPHVLPNILPDLETESCCSSLSLKPQPTCLPAREKVVAKTAIRGPQPGLNAGPAVIPPAE